MSDKNKKISNKELARLVDELVITDAAVKKASEKHEAKRKELLKILKKAKKKYVPDSREERQAVLYEPTSIKWKIDLLEELAKNKKLIKKAKAKGIRLKDIVKKEKIETEKITVDEDLLEILVGEKILSNKKFKTLFETVYLTPYVRLNSYVPPEDD